MNIFIFRQFIIMNVLLSLVLAGCAISKPTLTVAPSVPTATVEPTATLIPTSTVTFVPTAMLTHEPTVTATPILVLTQLAARIPTTSSVVAATRAPVTPAPISSAGVSFTGSLIDSIQKAFKVAQVIYGSFNKIVAGGYELCEPLIANYDSIINAPAYDVSAKSAQIQQAYGLYRQAIDGMNVKGDLIRSICAQKGGGAIGHNDVQVIQKAIGQSITWLGKAFDLVRYTPDAPHGSPLMDNVAQGRTRLQDIYGIFISLRVGFANEILPARANALACPTFLADWNWFVNAPTLDVSSQPANVSGAYGKYRAAVDLFKDRFIGMQTICTTGEGMLARNAYAVLRSSLDEVDGLLAEAQNLLSQ